MLTYHVVAGDIKSARAVAVARQNGTVKPLEGEAISLSLKDGKLILNGSATVVTADILATNGVIHVIDTGDRPAELVGLARRPGARSPPKPHRGLASTP